MKGLSHQSCDFQGLCNSSTGWDVATTGLGPVYFRQGDCPCGEALKLYGEALPDLRSCSSSTPDFAGLALVSSALTADGGRELLDMVVGNGSFVIVAGGGCGWTALLLSDLVGPGGEVRVYSPDIVGLERTRAALSAQRGQNTDNIALHRTCLRVPVALSWDRACVPLIISPSFVSNPPPVCEC